MLERATGPTTASPARTSSLAEAFGRVRYSTLFYPSAYRLLGILEGPQAKTEDYNNATAMDLQDFVENVPNLTDLELAVLLSLIAKQQCLVYTDDDLIDYLSSELALIVSETFKLSYVVLGADDLQSTDKFGDLILDENHKFANEADFDSDSDAIAALKGHLADVSFKGSRSSQVEHNLDTRMVVNVIIAKDFNYASHDVQIQVMELMLRRRIFSKTTVHPVPKTFLFLPIVANSTKHIKLCHHLVCISITFFYRC